ncbi:MAG: hypothetical protein KGI71_03940 [Patescibacteria group bacterium]|nr:hypothetical protein [Patescibacteria group bacterium]
MNPLAWLNPGRWMLYLALVAALMLGAWRLESHIEGIGYAKAKAECAAASAAQAAQNLDLQRSAELRYTVQAQTRDRVIVKTVKEIVHETDNLAACVLTAPALGLLNRAADCARADTAASCGPGDPLRSP